MDMSNPTFIVDTSPEFRNCGNCFHRQGKDKDPRFWTCLRTGYYTHTELTYGGKCHNGGQLMLWAPKAPDVEADKRGLIERAKIWLFGDE